MYLIIVLVAVSLSTSQCLQLPYRVGLTDPLSEQPNSTSPQGQVIETHSRNTPVENAHISVDDGNTSENTDSHHSTQDLDENTENPKNIPLDSSHKSADVLDENTDHRSTNILNKDKNNSSGDFHRSPKSPDEETDTPKLPGASKRSTIVLGENMHQKTLPTDQIKTVTSDTDKNARQSDIKEGSQSTSVTMQEPDSSSATILLQDIRDALQTQHDANLENRLVAVTRETESVSGEVARLSRSVDQRVDLLMDSLATLRLAVAGQAQQLVAVSNALNHVRVKPGLTHSPAPHNIQSAGPHLTHSSGIHNIQSAGPHLTHSPGPHTQSTAPHGIESPGHHIIHSPLPNIHIPVTHGIQSPPAPSSLLHTLPSINVGTHTISHIKKHNHTQLNITEDHMKDNHSNGSGKTQENIDFFDNTNPIPKVPINPQQTNNQDNPSNAEEVTEDTDFLSSLGAKLNSLTVQLLQLQLQVRDVQNSVVHLKKTSQETEEQQEDTIDTVETTNIKKVVEKDNTSKSQNTEAQQSDNTDTTPDKETQDLMETNQSVNTDKNPPTYTNKTQSSQETQNGELKAKNTQNSQQNTNNSQHSQKTQDTPESSNNPPKTTNEPKYTNISTSPDTKVTCECSTEELKNSIALLQDSHRHQQDKLDKMASNITKLGGVGKLEQMALNISKLGGGVDSGGFSQTVEDAEEVKALINDLQNLKEELQKEMSKRGTIIEGGNTTDTSTEQGMCVWPYRRGGGGCYYVHQDERLGWVAAGDHCKGLQGRLAAPPRLGTLHTFLLKQRLSRAYKYWLGASNSRGDGEWQWSDGRSVEVDVWGDAPPSTVNNRIHRCLAIKPGYKLVASAEMCRESRFFICQQERLL